MFGVRSPQPKVDDGQDGPSETDQFTAPVTALRLYTELFSVATITDWPTTSGCAYTWPLTGVLNSCPNPGPLTALGDRPGSFGSHPVRSMSWETVFSSA